jgi:hypothetical protein
MGVAGGGAGAAGAAGAAGVVSAAAAPAHARPNEATPAHMISFKFFIDYPLFGYAAADVFGGSALLVVRQALLSAALWERPSLAAAASGRHTPAVVFCATQQAI